TKGGEQAETYFGLSVNQAHDVNSDGLPDLVIGAPNWDDLNIGGSTQHGRMYVYSGVCGNLLFTCEGEHDEDQLGNSVSSAMDVNLDGYSDLVAGAPFWDDPILGGASNGRV